LAVAQQHKAVQGVDLFFAALDKLLDGLGGDALGLWVAAR